ncbi:MAG: CBS domain-containing protein [Pseudomonadota bacterium]
MSPISYQGPLEIDEKSRHTHSQSAESSMGLGQPGLTVESMLSDRKGVVHSVTPHSPVKEVVAELSRLRIGALVVIDNSNEPIGIVTERDIVHCAEKHGAAMFDLLSEAIMTADPKVCHPEDKIESVMKRMSDGGFRHMPVTDGGKLIGLVSIRDVVRHRMMEIEYENLKMRQAIVG